MPENRRSYLLIILLCAFSQAYSQDTCTVNGVFINSLLIDPTGLLENYDTNGDGIPNSNDEFVEICNSSQDSIDISGWTISDDDPPPGADYTIEPGTWIQSGECLLLVANYCPNDSVVCDPPPGVLDMGLDFLGLLANGGDLVMLSDTMGNNCAITYGTELCENIDPLDAPGFDPDNCDYWDTDVDGCPLLMIGDSCAYVPQALPLNLEYFEVYKDNRNRIILDWSVIASQSFDHYIIEWSQDLKEEMLELDVLHATQQSNMLFTHNSPGTGLNYYRITARSEGSIQWKSEVRVVYLDKIDTSIRSYPNPTNGRLYFEGLGENPHFFIFDLKGELIMKIIPKTKIESLDLNSLPDGVYVMRVLERNQISTIKFVKI